MSLGPCTTCSSEDGGMRRIIGKESLCAACSNKRDAEWRAKMAVRQNPDQFDIRKLVNTLLTQHWMHECEIRTEQRDGRDIVVVCWTEPGDEILRNRQRYLRHSAGPGTGTFWDNYGDDFHSPELALVELSKAYPPPRIDYVIPTHGN